MHPSARATPDHPVVAAFVRRYAADLPVVTAIDPRDEMLEHQLAVARGHLDRALFGYFRTGRGVARSYLRLLRWHFGDSGPARVLDFASGFGRVTRFLVRELDPAAIRVCEISGGAAAFQAETFGVGSVPPARRPEDFDCEERFDAILVTSLFTHLPESTFSAWLERLTGLLAPGGLLLFSVHDTAMLLPDLPLPEEGIRFEPSSESRTLEGDEYGSTWVDERWVRARLAEAAPGCTAHRCRYGLCDFQDLWLVARQGELPPPPPLPAEPQLFLERCELEGGQLRLGGWVMAHSEAAELRSLGLELAGRRLAETSDFEPRPDVEATQYRGPAYVHGWGLEVELPADTSLGADLLLLSAEDTAGEEAPLWLGPLEGALFEGIRVQLEHWRTEDRIRLERAQFRLAQARAETKERELLIESMRGSGFWKLREAWFTFKRALRLTDEA